MRSVIIIIIIIIIIIVIIIIILLNDYRFQSFTVIASLPSHFQVTSCLLCGNTTRGAFVEFHNLHM